MIRYLVYRPNISFLNYQALHHQADRIHTRVRLTQPEAHARREASPPSSLRVHACAGKRSTHQVALINHNIINETGPVQRTESLCIFGAPPVADGTRF